MLLSLLVCTDHCLPVLLIILALSKSPLDKCFRLKSFTILVAIVPFPDPGGPIIKALKTFEIIFLSSLHKEI